MAWQSGSAGGARSTLITRSVLVHVGSARTEADMSTSTTQKTVRKLLAEGAKLENLSEFEQEMVLDGLAEHLRSPSPEVRDAYEMQARPIPIPSGVPPSMQRRSRLTT